MLYLWIIGLISIGYMFFRFSPEDLMPPYSIDMGAVAISTLAGALLAGQAEQLGVARPDASVHPRIERDVLGDRDLVDPDAARAWHLETSGQKGPPFVRPALLGTGIPGGYVLGLHLGLSGSTGCDISGVDRAGQRRRRRRRLAPDLSRSCQASALRRAARLQATASTIVGHSGRTGGHRRLSTRGVTS